MRNEIEKLLESKISAAEIARNTGLDASTIQKLRLGQREVGKLSLENAERLSDYQKFITDMKIVNVDIEDIIEYGNEKYLGFYHIGVSDDGKSNRIDFITVREVKVNEENIFEVLDCSTDNIDINNDIDDVEGEILADYDQDLVYYFKNYKDATTFIKYKYKAKDLKTLLEEYKA